MCVWWWRKFSFFDKYQCDYGYHISLLIVDRECPAIKIAKENGISYSVLEKKVLGKSFFEEFEKIVPIDTNLIVLAGFLPIIPNGFVKSGNVK